MSLCCCCAVGVARGCSRAAAAAFTVACAVLSWQPSLPPLQASTAVAASSHPPASGARCVSWRSWRSRHTARAAGASTPSRWWVPRCGEVENGLASQYVAAAEGGEWLGQAA